MRINLTSVLVDDQDKALRFYTEVLGFKQKTDVPMGEHRWITVVSPEEQDGTELVLEPDTHPAVKPFKAALIADGIPFTSFAVDDIRAEFERLRGLGVRSTGIGQVDTGEVQRTRTPVARRRVEFAEKTHRVGSAPLHRDRADRREVIFGSVTKQPRRQ